MVYEPLLDRLILKTVDAGGLYSINPDTAERTTIVTTGNPNGPGTQTHRDGTAGVYGRFRRIPEMGGYGFISGSIYNVDSMTDGVGTLWFLKGP
jgi:hypothetical protein